MADHPKIKVLVMHNENLVDAGLAAILARQPDVDILEPCPPCVAESALLRWLGGCGADIVITDYDRGLWLAESLQRTQMPFRPVRPRTMIVTSQVTQAEIRMALKHGVAGYLTTTSTSREVIDAVREVHIGMRHVSEPLARSLLEDMLGEQLTPRESEVLGLAAQGCANKVIAARLRVELGTVKCHMKAVLDKLHAGNRTEAVVIANQRGLLELERVSTGARIDGMHDVLPMRGLPPSKVDEVASLHTV